MFYSYFAATMLLTVYCSWRWYNRNLVQYVYLTECFVCSSLWLDLPCRLWSHCSPRIRVWFKCRTSYSSILCFTFLPSYTKSTAILLDKMSKLLAKLICKGSLACCYLIQLCDADLMTSRILLKIKLCVIPKSTIADKLWPLTENGKSSSSFKV